MFMLYTFSPHLLQIKQFDHYPDKICDKCHKYLQVAYKFRVTCQKSHKHLSKFIAPVEVDQKEDELQCEEDTSDSIPMTYNEEGFVVEETNTNDLMIKLEPEHVNPPVKEEYTVHIQEEEEDFVEIYEPMTEEEEKEVFQLADEAFENDVCSNLTLLYDYVQPLIFSLLQSLAGSQEDVEFLELEEDLELPSSDNEEYAQVGANRKPVRSRVVMKRTIVKPSTSQQAVKRKRTGPREKKPKDIAYICDFCGNKYPSQGRLTEHIKLHKGIKPHECE